MNCVCLYRIKGHFLFIPVISFLVYEDTTIKLPFQFISNVPKNNPRTLKQASKVENSFFQPSTAQMIPFPSGTRLAGCTIGIWKLEAGPFRSTSPTGRLILRAKYPLLFYF